MRRYERARPGELLHLAAKKPGRITGFFGHRITADRSRRRQSAGREHVHVVIDDHARLAYVEVLRHERGETTAAFLRRALAWYTRLRVRVTAIMTDNASGYVGRRFAPLCAQLGMRHLRTRPYRGCTNGKAER